MTTSPIHRPQKVLSLGGSQNIGYHTALRLLEKGCTVTFLLRNPARFDADEAMEPYIRSGQARLVKGDALVEDDVRRAWLDAVKGGDGDTLDMVVFTIGTTKIKIGLKGLEIDPPNICAASVLNVLSTMPASLREPDRQPKLVVVSSSGIGKRGVAALPMPHRILYPIGLWSPHRDKLALERVVAHASGATWFDTVDKPNTDATLPDRWSARAGAAGELPNIVVIRPAWLTDGAATGIYRTDPLATGFKTISRKDVAHFIVEDVFQNWDKWKGQATGIGY